MSNLQTLGWVIGICCCVCGCGRSSEGMRVWGQVSLDGAPVKEGQIVLTPAPGSSGPTTGAAIVDGAYEIAAEKGPAASATYRVEITAKGAERSYSPNVDGSGPTITTFAQIVPPQFNRESTLTIQISADTDQNQHDFSLSTTAASR